MSKLSSYTYSGLLVAKEDRDLEAHRFPKDIAITFRLLKLHPGRPEDPLKCDLFETPFKDFPEYEAISYVWGARSERDVITCQGRDITITPSLALALRTLRRSDETRLLWADQICINQRDQFEKAFQIGRMGEIFRDARRVFMYLNPAENGLEKEAADFVEEAASLPQTTFAEWDAPTESELKDRGLPASDSTTWSALSALVELSYWKRCWVLQEVRLARDHLILWGGHEISWLGLQNAASFLLKNRGLLHHTSKTVFDNARVTDALQNIIKTGERSEKKLDMLELLLLTSVRDATEVRDRVFSIYGMMDRVPEWLPVNYDRSLVEVFGETAWHIIRERQDLRLLSASGLTNQQQFEQIESWPSWLPQWQSTTLPRAIEWSCPGAKADGLLAIGKGFSLPDTKSWRTLEMRTIHVDQVDHIVETDGRRLHGDDISVRFAAAWTLCLENLDQEKLTEPLIRIILLCHLCGERGFSKSANVNGVPKWDDKVLSEFGRQWMTFAYPQLVQPDTQQTFEIPDMAIHQQIADAAMIASDKPDPFPKIIGGPEFNREAKRSIDEYWEQLEKLPEENKKAYLDIIERMVKLPAETTPVQDVSSKAPKRMRDKFRGLLHKKSSRHDDTITFNSVPEPARTLVPFLYNAYVADPPAPFMRFPHRWFQSTYSRRFFITKDGRTGMAPDIVRPGDVVKIVIGHNVPMLLRPVADNKYVYIGECYVHGIMRGELIKDLLWTEMDKTTLDDWAEYIEKNVIEEEGGWAWLMVILEKYDKYGLTFLEKTTLV